MADDPQPASQYTMKLCPLKPHDRFKHPMSYDFQHANPKKQETVVDLPVMDFTSPLGIPAFMSPSEKYFLLRNPNYFKESFDRRLDRGNEEELKLLLFPKPLKKSRYCGICSQFYEDYYAHVLSESHKAKFGNHPFLPQLYKEMRKIHTTFMKGQWKHTQEAVESPDDSPLEKLEEMRALFSSDKKQRSKSYEPNEQRQSNMPELPKRDTQEDSLKENLDLKTAKKEVYQTRKSTKKKNSIKALLMKPEEGFIEDNRVQSHPNDAETVLNRNSKQEHRIDITTNTQPLKNLRKMGANSNFSSGDKESKRVYYKLQQYVDKSDNTESLRNKPVPLKLEKSRLKSLKSDINELRSPSHSPIIVSNREEPQIDLDPSPMKEEEEQQEIKFRRRNPEKKLKRDYYKLSENEEDLVSQMKKVKLNDSQSVKNCEESIKIDLQISQNRKWQGLKNSFAEFLGELKGTMNRLYEFWKKKGS